MTVLSKAFSKISDLLLFLGETRERKINSFAALGLVLLIIKLKRSHKKAKYTHLAKGLTKKKGNINADFLKRLYKLIKIVVPSWNESVVLDIASQTFFLVIRTILSIYISTINGSIVKCIVNYDFPGFLRKLGSLLMIALPASFINSYLEYINKIIALKFRKNMTKHFHKIYIKDMIYYQLTNIDSRIGNPDQRLTNDIEKWSTSLSQLYSNFTKPLLDLILFGSKLATYLSWKGPAFALGWYIVAGAAMRVVAPSFGKLRAIEQILEGDFRSGHTDLIHFSEEIAFLGGEKWEKRRISGMLGRLLEHLRDIMSKRLYMGTFDSLLVKYGATLCGYTILGIPVFGPGSGDYLKRMKTDPSGITKDYIRNSSLLINMSKAIGRLTISYKELQNLAGYTHLLDQMEEVLEELNEGIYKRDQVEDSTNLNMLSRGEFLEAKFIRFEDVPIVAPNGDILVDKINFTIEPGMNCIVSGPNGCGKSSSFRILGQLWPLFGGKLHRPKIDKLFYIPQRPYLPHGTLRDQIIYPHLELAEGFTDDDILNLMEEVHLGYMSKREGGLDTINNWNDVFSGGEKQRIAIARLFYHKPQFAILDECTSAINLEDEHILYSKARDLNVTLFTISHRQSLFKFHDYYLKFDGQGGWSFKKLTMQQKGVNDDSQSNPEKAGEKSDSLSK